MHTGRVCVHLDFLHREISGTKENVPCFQHIGQKPTKMHIKPRTKKRKEKEKRKCTGEKKNTESKHNRKFQNFFRMELAEKLHQKPIQACILTHEWLHTAVDVLVLLET